MLLVLVTRVLTGLFYYVPITVIAFPASQAFAETSPYDKGEAMLPLDLAIGRALAGNPGLAEIKARAEALSAVPSQVGALPDPVVSVEMLNVPTNSFDLHKEDMTMMGFGVSQAIPFPGKLALREQIAEHEALAAAESVEEARLRLVSEVKQAWWRLFYYDRALMLLDGTEQFYRQLIDIAQSNYKFGKGSQQDVLMAQLELSKLKEEKLEMVSLRHSQAARINALLNRQPASQVLIPAEAKFVLPALVESVLQEQALKMRPLFAQHNKMLDVAHAKVDLAKQDFYPDFTVGAGYAVRQNTPTGQSRSDFASVQLSMDLPINTDRKQAKAVDQRQSELLQEQYSLEDEHHKIQAVIAAKAAEYQHAKEKLRLLEHEIVPQAQQTLNALLAGYQTSQARFTDLLRTQLGLLQYQTQYWQALVSTQELLAQLSAAVGEELAHD